MLGPKCSKCGIEDSAVNLAHTTHDPKAGELVALFCASCHSKFDAKQRHAMARRTRAKRVGQLWLLDEIKWAPYPHWEVPRAVLVAAQGRLFDG